jgi:uncharacterized protein (TIRG00374 family)
MRRRLRWLGTAAAVALLLVAARSVAWSETWEAMRGASLPLLLLAAAVNGTSLLVRGTRWWVFLRSIGAPSLGVAVRGAVVGSGLNNVLPANGGEAARVVLVARSAGVSSATVLATLALDRLVELLSGMALLVMAPLVAPLPALLDRWREHAAVALAAGLVVCALLAREAPARQARQVASTAWHSRVRAYVARFVAGLRGLPTPKRLGSAVGLSLVAWAGQLATYHLAARAVGLPATLPMTMAALLAVNVAFLVQATPGNVGIFQLVYALIMTAFGLSHHTAVAAAVLIQALQIIPVTALALVLAPELAGRRPLPAPVIAEVGDEAA